MSLYSADAIGIIMYVVFKTYSKYGLVVCYMIFEHVQPLQVLLIIQFKHEGF